MSLKELFRRKRTPFDELWKQVDGIPDGIKKQIYEDISDKTKKKLEKDSPKEIEEYIIKAIEAINNGSTEEIDTLIRRMNMSNHMRKKIIINVVMIGAIITAFLIINISIDVAYKHRLSFVPDGSQYCYGIDSLNKDGNILTLRGWFFELKSVKNIEQKVSPDDAELMLALVPVEEAVVGVESKNAVFMDLKAVHENRPDVNEYFICEYDYSKCGFTATVDCNDIDIQSNYYRIAIKRDADLSSMAVLTNIYITDKGLSFTDPRQSPELDTAGTDLDNIVKEGVRLVSVPDYNCYVYQLEDKLYWIADEGYEFNEDGATYIQYQMDTTQIDNLPTERLENNWFWSNISDLFENHEITGLIDCGKYRVLEREIPSMYSVTNIITGYYNGEWIWCSEFKPYFPMLMK